MAQVFSLRPVDLLVAEQKEADNLFTQVSQLEATVASLEGQSVLLSGLEGQNYQLQERVYQLEVQNAHLQAALRDRSELNKAQETIRELEHRIASIQEGLPQLVAENKELKHIVAEQSHDLQLALEEKERLRQAIEWLQKQLGSVHQTCTSFLER
eukprot:TRINITY_DN17354_c0_g1_i2.p2 TRINITY_DN17354_c0_g1~~TRINITY_DN17354_c0_g1_i2.p2  ORF type:complete len:155 (-),score=36.06 TRINITY_DN17354_c0_g1_i2:924-1388(-)